MRVYAAGVFSSGPEHAGGKTRIGRSAAGTTPPPNFV